MSLLPRLLKTFYRTGLPCLPVAVPAGTGTPGATGDLELIGFAVRAELDQAMADLDRARGDFSEIPEPILVRDQVPSEALASLRVHSEIPVLNLQGEQVANWTEARFLKAVAAFRETLKPSAAETAGKASHSIAPDVSGRTARATFSAAGGGASPEHGPSAQRWLGELILGALPYALFATDLQGHTLFYNGRFEDGILTRRALKNSIRLAESFFLELTRTLLARSFEEDPLRKNRNVLTTYHSELEVRIRVLNLEQDGRLQGYLYLFQDPGDGELFHELVDRVGRGQGLEAVIDEVEGQFIYLMLDRHGQNVSHTAKALKIKRSTLQNKIKRLRIDQRYNRKVQGPVRRHRRTVAEILAASADPEPAAETHDTARRSSKGDVLASGTKKKSSVRSAKKSPVKKSARQKSAQAKSKKSSGKTSGKASNKASKNAAAKTSGRASKKSGSSSGTKKKAAQKTSRK